MDLVTTPHRRGWDIRLALVVATLAGLLVSALAVASPARADDTLDTGITQACTPQSTLTDQALRDKLLAAGSHVADPSDATGTTATMWSAVLVVPDDLCEATVSFSSYLLPSGFFEPFEDQELYDNITATYAPGRYDLTVDVPTPCGWQVDLYVGSLLWPLIPHVGHPGNRQIDVATNNTGMPCEDEEPEVSGTLEIRKDTNPDLAAASFAFTASFGDPAGFALADGETTGAMELSGAHWVTEQLTVDQVEDGWSLTSVTCTGDAATSVDGATAAVTVDPGETIVCTFLNTRTDGGTAPGNPTPTPSEGTAPPSEGTQGGNPPQELPDTAVGSASSAPAIVAAVFVGMLALLGLTRAIAPAYRRRVD